MPNDTLMDSSLWRRFEAEARRRKEDPNNLVTAYLRQCLEIWQDEALDEQIGSEVRQSGYGEDDAVEIVRGYRRAKTPHATS